MATVPHFTSGSGLRKFQADGFLLDRVYVLCQLGTATDAEGKNLSLFEFLS